MSKIYTSIDQLIGNTPLLRLTNIEKKYNLQAKLLAKHEGNATMQAALVYRGGKENADKFLATQDEYFNNAGGGVNG